MSNLLFPCFYIDLSSFSAVRGSPFFFLIFIWVKGSFRSFIYLFIFLWKISFVWGFSNMLIEILILQLFSQLINFRLALVLLSFFHTGLLIVFKINSNRLFWSFCVYLGLEGAPFCFFQFLFLLGFLYFLLNLLSFEN